MTPLIQAEGNTIRDILALIRRSKGWNLKDSREVLRSGGDDNLYRIHLANGAIVEATVIQHRKCIIHVDTSI